MNQSRRASLSVLALAISALGPARAQALRPHFDVATLKRNTACAGRGGGPPSHGRFNMECTTLQNLIQIAYGVLANGANINMKMLEIVGGPSWMQTDTYQINAKAEGDESFGQMGPLLQTLLEDRFKLKIHRDTKEVPVYFLTIAKGGVKLEPTKEGVCVPINLNRVPEAPAPGQPAPVPCGSGSTTTKGGAISIVNHGLTMELFSTAALTHFAGRPVIDRTGLAGLYEVHLEFTPDAGIQGLGGRGAPGDTAGPPSSDPAGPSIFTALQEQLGLKLEPGKGPIEILVIDHVERPSEN